MTRPLLKFCGLTRETDFRAAEALGADFAGFIFSHASPRAVDPAVIGRWSPRFRFRGRIRKVGVFVNAPFDEVRMVVRLAGLDAVQLHGDEDGAFGRALGVPWWKAIRLASSQDVKDLARFEGASFLLLDAFVAGVPGGTGRAIPRELAEDAIGRIHAAGFRALLAGGLRAESIADALRLGPDGVDVNSGVEVRPGVKDPTFMHRAADAAFRPAPRFDGRRLWGRLAGRLFKRADRSET